MALSSSIAEAFLLHLAWSSIKVPQSDQVLRGWALNIVTFEKQHDYSWCNKTYILLC